LKYKFVKIKVPYTNLISIIGNILEIKWLLLLSIDKNRHIHALKDPPTFSTSCGWVFL